LFVDGPPGHKLPSSSSCVVLFCCLSNSWHRTYQRHIKNSWNRSYQRGSKAQKKKALRGLPGDDLESDKSWAERKPLANCSIKGAEANLPPVGWGVHEGRKEGRILILSTNKIRANVKKYFCLSEFGKTVT